MSDVTNRLDAIIWQNALIVYQQAGMLHELQKFNQKENTIMAELQNLEEAVAKIEADAANIATNVQATRDEVATLTQQVADLQTQIAAGTAIDPAAVQAIADRVTAVDVSLDAIVPTP